MDDIPSISTGAVGSRFVSQNDIDSAKAKRDEQWKSAYARLGQEPPPQPVEDVYDGRSLAEKLAANKAAKQEEWEEKSKLANQFRALEEDEVMFLDSIMDQQHQQELKRKQQDAEEVEGFKQAVAAKNSVAPQPSTFASAAAPSTSKSMGTTRKAPTVASAQKKPKVALKGVIIKKKKLIATTKSTLHAKPEDLTPNSAEPVIKENQARPEKKQKVSEPS